MRITATNLLKGKLDLSSLERLQEQNVIESKPFRLTICPGASIVVDDQWYSLINIQSAVRAGYIVISEYSVDGTFLSLADTPTSYSGQGGKTVKVNAGGTGIEFSAGSNGSITMNYVAKTGAYILESTDYTVDCTANTFALTLPTAVGIVGQIYNLKNSGTGVITINTTSSQTIDGNASGTLTLNQYDNLQVQSNNANWIIL